MPDGPQSIHGTRFALWRKGIDHASTGEAVSQRGLDNRRRQFFAQWPVGRELDRVLRTATNPTPLFYFADARNADLSRCSWALGRLGKELEKRFGLAGEILILFTPYEDLQRRTFNALTERLRDEVVEHQREVADQIRFTPDPTIALLFAPDPRAVEKVESWNLEGGASLVAAVPTMPSASSGLRERVEASLLSVLSDRDLYQGRNPVTGNDFFGRDQTLRALLGGFRDGHSIGLFGLRRSGKTSVVQEFKRRNSGRGFVVVASDLEAISSLAELPAMISADLNAALRDLRELDPSVWVGSLDEQRAENFAELATRVQKVSERNSRFTFVLAFDEVESLVPFVRSDPMQVRTFLGALRRAAQGSQRVCLLLTGVTSRFFRDSMLDAEHAVENPLFGFVDELFLGPFNEHETANLIEKLGRGMMLDWDQDALSAVQELTGGFPFFVRDLASVARSTARRGPIEPDTAGNRFIGRETVESAFVEWRDSAAGLWGQIVQTLATHHELMAEMVRSRSVVELDGWLQLGDEADDAARSLGGLGLLVNVEGAWRPSPTLEALQGLNRSPSAALADVKATNEQRRMIAGDLAQLINTGESASLEFKSSARVNLKTGEVDERIRHSFVKSVAAFLNAEGGVVLLGVADDGSIVGLDRDVKASNRSLDKYLLQLHDCLRTALGEPVVASHVSIEPIDVDGGSVVCRVSVRRHDDGVWLDDDGTDCFYVRNGNQTLKLRSREVADYLKHR